MDIIKEINIFLTEKNIHHMIAIIDVFRSYFYFCGILYYIFRHTHMMKEKFYLYQSKIIYKNIFS